MEDEGLDDEDIVWEEDNSQVQDGGVAEGLVTTHLPPTDHDENDGNIDANCQIEITVSCNSQTKEKKNDNSTPKSRKINFTSDHYNLAFQRHIDSITDFCDDMATKVMESFDLIILEKLKTYYSDGISELLSNCDKSLNNLLNICRWFHATFTWIKDDDVTEDEGKEGSTAEELIHTVIPNKAGCSFQLNQLFLGLLTANGFQVRFAITLDPVSYLPQDHEDIHENAVILSLKKLNAEKTLTKLLRSRAKKANSKLYPQSWLEVFVDMNDRNDHKSSSMRNDEVNRRWIHIDVVRSLWDSPGAVEKVLRSGHHVHYVVAFEPCRTPGGDLKVTQMSLPDGGSNHKPKEIIIIDDEDIVPALPFVSSAVALLDNFMPSSVPSKSDVVLKLVHVTQRYNHIYIHCNQRDKQIRLKLDKWWISFIEEWNQSDRSPANQSGSWHRSSRTGRGPKKRLLNTNMTHADRMDYDAVCFEKSHKVPNSLQEFKDHPVYALERHLLANETFHPDAASHIVSTIKGEAIYLKQFQETLYTKSQWRKLMRIVKENEEPVKTVQRSVRRKVQTESSVESSTMHPDYEISTLKLFGSWQTIELKIEPVTNGILPVNSFGNIEVWDGSPAFIPKGATYIPGVEALQAVKTLEIQYAPALTGFGQFNGNTSPIFNGVVVLSDQADMVHDAINYLQIVKEENYIFKKETGLIKKWEKIVRRLLNRLKLKEKYGH